MPNTSYHIMTVIEACQVWKEVFLRSLQWIGSVLFPYTSIRFQYGCKTEHSGLLQSHVMHEIFAKCCSLAELVALPMGGYKRGQ